MKTGIPIIVLSGPTASGKTHAALSIARELPVEIINADSMQVYRGMDIGTAKPSPEERAEVPHHLIDVAEPDEQYSAGRFVKSAEETIGLIRERGKFPLVTGGTGMYIRALMRGLDALPSDAAVRRGLARRFGEEGGDALHGALLAVDPVSAARIHPRDRARLLRALEIAEITGVAPSALKGKWGAGKSRYETLFLALRLSREALNCRIDARVEMMFREGFVDEVRGLLAKGYGPEQKSMGALGYRHVVSHLLHGVPLEKATAEMKRDTRSYAKRQMTWLSREPDVVWLERDSATWEAVSLAKKILF